MWQERGAEIVYRGWAASWDPFRLLSARRIRTEGRICGGCTQRPVYCVCVCVCSSPLAGSIFVYWTTFCQLLIAHQLPPTVQQCRFCRLSRLQGCKDRQRARACGDKKGVKVQKAGLEQEGQTSESRHLVGELTSYETETAGGVTRNLSVATHQTHILYTAVRPS